MPPEASRDKNKSVISLRPLEVKINFNNIWLQADVISRWLSLTYTFVLLKYSITF